MHEEPTLWSSLAEHWQVARKLRSLQIYYDPGKCRGIWQCYEVCPVGCWVPDRARRKAVHQNPDLCVACGACVLQCPEGAIELR